MEAPNSSLVDYYRASAPLYDGVYRKPERQADLRRIETWVGAEFAGRRVLDVACGTGYWTQFIAERAAHVTGVDAAPEMLARARIRVPSPNARFVAGDAYALAPDLGTFDAAFSGFFLSHVPKAKLRPFAAQLNSRLVPGSRVLLIDNRFVDGSSSPIDGSDAGGNTYQVRRLADGTAHRVIKNFLTEHELRSCVDEIGRDVDYLEFQYYWALHYAIPDR
jgi:demethylmenaquinone methyltransferase/2-methoxy-6-polyprenyl-1,4-benzoquinol methylase